MTEEFVGRLKQNGTVIRFGGGIPFKESIDNLDVVGIATMIPVPNTNDEDDDDEVNTNSTSNESSNTNSSEGL